MTRRQGGAPPEQGQTGAARVKFPCATREAVSWCTTAQRHIEEPPASHQLLDASEWLQQADSLTPPPRHCRLALMPSQYRGQNVKSTA